VSPAEILIPPDLIDVFGSHIIPAVT